MYDSFIFYRIDKTLDGDLVDMDTVLADFDVLLRPVGVMHTYTRPTTQSMNIFLISIL